MRGNEFSPVVVTAFSKSYLVDLIRHKTGWDQRSEVSGKDQLNYLCDYLQVDHISAKTMVVENEYVDRHYLEDYAEYYARCFPSHPRMCSRIHFFANFFEEHEFTNSLSTNDSAFSKRLNENYIGFAVIRPIPHTFFAKLCIRPYHVMHDHDDYRLITRDTTVSLFGISLTVKNAPFAEQDKVVSACATSALWTFFGSSNESIFGKLPSPSAITKSATQNRNDGTRIFPTSGLTEPQIATSLKHFGLEPLWLTCNEDQGFFDLKEAIYAYISNDTPVLMGGAIYKIKGSEVTCLGRHLVCALGCHLGDSINTENNLKMYAHRIDKFYVHDDRLGPYLRLDGIPINFTTENGEERFGFKVSHPKNGVEVFVPEFALVGLEHKIRVPYESIRDICAAFHTHLCQARVGIINSLENSALEKINKDYQSELLAALSIATESEWEIALTTNTQIRADLLENKSFESFNGIGDKTALLLKNMPKHIWRCRIRCARKNKSEFFSDILFDATEIPQGKLLIGYLSYSVDSERMWLYVERAVGDGEWQEFNNDAKPYIGTFLKFFSEHAEQSYLNTMYGPLHLSLRNLKSSETDIQDNVIKRKDVFVIRRGDSTRTWNMLSVSTKYIWVVDSNGDFVVGEDIVREGIFKGHPTLVDGRPARLGGELWFDHVTSIWCINLKSRAYSAGIEKDSPKYKKLVNTVLTHNLAGLSTAKNSRRQ
jgi:hypothetical protein